MCIYAKLWFTERYVCACVCVWRHTILPPDILVPVLSLPDPGNIKRKRIKYVKTFFKYLKEIYLKNNTSDGPIWY